MFNLRFFALFAARRFNLLLIYLVVVRNRPGERSSGLLPRFFGVAGTFLGVGIICAEAAEPLLALADPSPRSWCSRAAWARPSCWRKLGKAFSIMPEARRW